MKILVAIANHGTKNRTYLERLLSEYRAMPWQTDIVVISDAPKTLPEGIQVVVGAPNKDPWSLPFRHRELFAEHVNDYDLFIYSEDDTLVTQANVQSFLDVTESLCNDEVLGFMRSESDGTGNRFVSSVHAFFRWLPEAAIRRSEHLLVPFTNDHAACYMLTRGQLQTAIASGGFLVSPHEGRYDMLCAAATDVYTQCGLKRYICVSKLSEFVLPHLPNKYVGKLGVPWQEVMAQVEALSGVAHAGRWRGALFEPETGLLHGQWSKNLYEEPDEALLALVPASARRVLSLGCGWGATEAALKSDGRDVVAVPLDPVFGDAVRRRGVRTVEGSLTEALSQLRGSQFDAVILADVLHLVPDPKAWLMDISKLVSPGGHVVLSVPQTRDFVARVRRIRPSERRKHRAAGAGVQSTNAATVRSWLDETGFAVETLAPLLSGRRERLSSASGGVLRTLLAERLLARGVRRG